MRHVAGRALVSLTEALGCTHEEETVPIFCGGNSLSIPSKTARKNIHLKNVLVAEEGPNSVISDWPQKSCLGRG